MDSISIKIYEDGQVEVKTSDISDGNHMSADELLAQMEELLGGQVTRKDNPDKHRHVHVGKKAFAK